MLSRHHRRIGTSVRAVALVAFAVMVFFFASAQLSAMQQANAATVAQQQVSAVEAVVGPPLSGAAVQAVMVPAPVTAIQPAVTDAGGATREVSCTVANDPDMCLPMFRWASSSSHIVNAISVDISITNLDFGWVGPLIGSLALGLVMSIGSLPWLILGLLTKMASSSVVSMQAWEFADKITANIGSFLFTGPGIAGFVVVLIIVVIAMSLRRKPAKTIGLYALVTVLLMGVGLVVTTGADNSTPSSEGTPYAAGTMSPGWIGIKATSLTTGLSSAISNMAVSLIPAAGFNNYPAGKPAIDTTSDPWGCQQYMASLEQLWAADRTAQGGSTGIALAMNQLWVQDVYMTYSKVQFGAATSNGADYAACRILDQGANVAPSEQINALPVPARDQVDAIPGGETIVAESPLFATVSSGDRMQSKMTAWSYCRSVDGTWKLAGWSDEFINEAYRQSKNAGQDSDALTDTNKGNAACQQAFAASATAEGMTAFVNAGGDDYNKVFTAFHYDNDTNKLSDSLATSGLIYDYQQNARGYSSMSNLLMMSTYVASSVLKLLGFGVILLVAWAMSILPAIFMSMFVVVVALNAFSPRDNGGKLKSYFFANISLIILGSMASAFVSIIIAMSQLLNQLWPPNGALQSALFSIWSGITPLVVMATLHFVITKFTPLPSPFSLKGLSSYIKAGMNGSLSPITSAGAQGKNSSDPLGLKQRYRRAKMAEAFALTAGTRAKSGRNAAGPRSVDDLPDVASDGTVTEGADAGATTRAEETPTSEGTEGTTTEGTTAEGTGQVDGTDGREVPGDESTEGTGQVDGDEATLDGATTASQVDGTDGREVPGGTEELDVIPEKSVDNIAALRNKGADMAQSMRDRKEALVTGMGKARSRVASGIANGLLGAQVLPLMAADALPAAGRALSRIDARAIGANIRDGVSSGMKRTANGARLAALTGADRMAGVTLKAINGSPAALKRVTASVPRTPGRAALAALHGARGAARMTGKGIAGTARGVRAGHRWAKERHIYDTASYISQRKAKLAVAAGLTIATGGLAAPLILAHSAIRHRADLGQFAGEHSARRQNRKQVRTQAKEAKQRQAAAAALLEEQARAEQSAEENQPVQTQGQTQRSAAPSKPEPTRTEAPRNERQEKESARQERERHENEKANTSKRQPLPEPIDPGEDIPETLPQPSPTPQPRQAAPVVIPAPMEPDFPEPTFEPVPTGGSGARDSSGSRSNDV